MQNKYFDFSKTPCNNPSQHFLHMRDGEIIDNDEIKENDFIVICYNATNYATFKVDEASVENNFIRCVNVEHNKCLINLTELEVNLEIDADSGADILKSTVRKNLVELNKFPSNVYNGHSSMYGDGVSYNIRKNGNIVYYTSCMGATMPVKKQKENSSSMHYCGEDDYIDINIGVIIGTREDGVDKYQIVQTIGEMSLTFVTRYVTDEYINNTYPGQNIVESITNALDIQEKVCFTTES